MINLQRPTTLIFLCLWALQLISCSKTIENRSIEQGGQDSGGGNTTVSTLQDVEFYFNRAREQLGNVILTFLDTKTIHRFKDAKKRNLLYEVSNKITALDNQSESPEIAVGLQRLIKSSEINIRKDTHCSSVDKTHSYASIKSFSIGSPICISFSELAKLPKSSLDREIISLLFHEYLHALGYEDEKVVMILQNSFVQNYDRIFPNGTKIFEQRSNENSSHSSEVYDLLTNYSIELQAFAGVKIDTKVISEEQENAWASICKKVQAVRISVSSLQQNDLLTLTRLGPQLVDSGDITDFKIDEHLNKIDTLRYDISNKTIALEHNCDSNLKAAASRKGNELFRITPTSIQPLTKPLNEVQKDMNSIGNDLISFLENLKTSESFIQRYN